MPDDRTDGMQQDNIGAAGMAKQRSGRGGESESHYPESSRTEPTDGRTTPEGAEQQRNPDTERLETDDLDSRLDRETPTKMVTEMAEECPEWPTQRTTIEPGTVQKTTDDEDDAEPTKTTTEMVRMAELQPTRPDWSE